MSRKVEKASTSLEQPQKKLIAREVVEETLGKIEGFFLLPPHPATKKLTNGRSAHYCDAITFHQTQQFKDLFLQSCMNSQIPATLASIVHEFITGEKLQKSKEPELPKKWVGTRWVKDSNVLGGERAEPIYEHAKPETRKAKDVVDQMGDEYQKLDNHGTEVQPKKILSDCYFVLKTINEILKQSDFYFATDRPGVEAERKTRGELMALTLKLRDNVTGLLPYIDSDKRDEEIKKCLEDASKVIKDNLGKSSLLRTPTAFFQSLSDPTKEITAFLGSEKAAPAAKSDLQKPSI